MIFRLPFTITFFLALSLFCFLSTPLYPQGICSRTDAIETAILGLIPSVTDCNLVTDGHLAGITGGLTADGVTPVSGDFSGLTGITSLILRNGSFTTLPSDIFSGLVSLEAIRLLGTVGNTCDLEELKEGTFQGLTSLEVINMDNCSLTLAGLPDNLFDGLNSLEEIHMLGNAGLTGRMPARLVLDVSDTLTGLTLPSGVTHEVGLATLYTTLSEGGASGPLRAFSTYSGGFTASLATDGTADEGTDYTLASPIVVASDSFEGFVDINPLVDSTTEGDQTIIVSITGITISGSDPVPVAATGGGLR